MHKTIAVDFDKTLAEYESGTFSPTDVGKPNPGAINFLKALKQMGFGVIIFSVRANTRGGKLAIEQWVKQYAPGLVEGVTHLKMGNMEFFVDDRAIHYDGDFKVVLKEILRRSQD